MKTFADDKKNMTQKQEIFLRSAGNFVGKGEYASKQCFLFPLYIQSMS